MAEVEMIAAVSSNLVIGLNGKMPWHLSEDLKHFKEVTMGHVVIMGRVTFESIGKCLPNRRNIVVSSSLAPSLKGPEVVGSFNEALALAGDVTAMIIGGARLYEQALPYAKTLHLTRILKEFKGDTYFPQWREYPFKLVSKSSFHSASCGFDYSFETWSRLR